MITPTTYLVPFKIEPPGSTTPFYFSNLYMPIKWVLKKYNISKNYSIWNNKSISSNYREKNLSFKYLFFLSSLVIRRLVLNSLSVLQIGIANSLSFIEEILE